MKKLIVPILSAVLMPVFIACTDEADSNKENVNIHLSRTDIELNGKESDIAADLYKFPIDLLKSAYKSDSGDNILISPLSSSMVLGMIANAVDEGQRENLMTAMNLKPGELEILNRYSQKMAESLPSIDPYARFNMSNSFWINREVNISASYRNILSQNYLAEFNNFESFNEEAIRKINNWVKTKTDNGFDKIFEIEEASPYVVAIWLNAIHFKGIWTQMFEPKNTKNKPFYVDYPQETNIVNTDMMYGYNFRYSYAFIPDGAQYPIKSVMLPYGNESFIFTAVLPAPDKPDILFTLGNLDEEYWNRIDQISSYEQENNGKVRVWLPKFKLERTNDLIPLLKDMGIEDIFDGVSMKESLGFSDTIKIDIFRQGVSIDLDEEGAEIKTITAADGFISTANPDFENERLIELNRPFIYFVRERSTGTVILAGIYNHPE